MGYAGGFVLVSFCYVLLRRLLQLAALRVRSNDFKELEIVVLLHELAILRRQRQRPALTTVSSPRQPPEGLPIEVLLHALKDFAHFAEPC
jgi:hypothetical protein